MPRLNSLEPNASHVTALYRDGWKRFDLPEGATLMELAGQLRKVASMHNGLPTAIKVQLDSAERLTGSQQRRLDLDQALSLVDDFLAHLSGPSVTHPAE